MDSVGDLVIAGAADRVGGLAFKKGAVFPPELWSSPIRRGFSVLDPKQRVIAFDVAPSKAERKKLFVRVEIGSGDLLEAFKAKKSFRDLVSEKIAIVVREKGWVCPECSIVTENVAGRRVCPSCKWIKFQGEGS